MREGPLLAVWAIATIALTALVLVRAESRAMDDPVQKGARGEITGLGEYSLVRADRFGTALRAIAEEYPDGTLTSVRVEPTRLDANVALPGFRTALVQVDTGLDVAEQATGEGVGRGLKPASIPADAPERMLKTVNRRSGTTPADLGYLTTSQVPQAAGGRLEARPGWYLKLRRGTRPDRRDYVARLDGKAVRGSWEPAR